jgi:hypothetical protein
VGSPRGAHEAIQLKITLEINFFSTRILKNDCLQFRKACGLAQNINSCSGKASLNKENMRICPTVMCVLGMQKFLSAFTQLSEPWSHFSKLNYLQIYTILMIFFWHKENCSTGLLPLTCIL